MSEWCFSKRGGGFFDPSLVFVPLRLLDEGGCLCAVISCMIYNEMLEVF